jgi:tRNA U34 5-carboxymethylaminomethyl modifying GTPase MnmE/TrmE
MNVAIIINEDELKNKLSEISREILAGLFDEIRAAHPPAREVMTIAQLAGHWQVGKSSILNWVRREDSPLPCHYVGSDPRFHLSEVNVWSKNEALMRLNRKKNQ